MSDDVQILLSKQTITAIVRELTFALEAMTPFKVDPLEFSHAAHKVKDKHINAALDLLQENLTPWDGLF